MLSTPRLILKLPLSALGGRRTPGRRPDVVGHVLDLLQPGIFVSCWPRIPKSADADHLLDLAEHGHGAVDLAGALQRTHQLGHAVAARGQVGIEGDRASLTRRLLPDLVDVHLVGDHMALEGRHAAAGQRAREIDGAAIGIAGELRDGERAVAQGELRLQIVDQRLAGDETVGGEIDVGVEGLQDREVERLARPAPAAARAAAAALLARRREGRQIDEAAAQGSAVTNGRRRSGPPSCCRRGCSGRPSATDRRARRKPCCRSPWPTGRAGRACWPAADSPAPSADSRSRNSG